LLSSKPSRPKKERGVGSVKKGALTVVIWKVPPLKRPDPTTRNKSGGKNLRRIIREGKKALGKREG